jgi:hypothetical protein
MTTEMKVFLIIYLSRNEYYISIIKYAVFFYKIRYIGDEDC